LARGHYVFFSKPEPFDLTLNLPQFDTRTQEENDVPRQ
jgi:hypothetical protein